MFNFIFDSPIGNMLAPVTSAVCQFHLAIQHNRVDEINSTIQAGVVPLGDTRDAGLADVHVACRYNNRFALELLINRGVPKDIQDKYGNTCVHYCSKYGHLDLCRWLIGLGCSPVTRNSSGQTPYDVAENHLIRQYLLPLQFQAERDSNGKEYIGAGGPMNQGPVVPVESSPLFEAANSLMAPRPAYPGYVTAPSSGGPQAGVPPVMPPYPGAPPAPAGVPMSYSNENLSAQPPPAVPPAVANSAAGAVAPARPPIAGGVVVNKMPAFRIPTNTSGSSLDEAGGPSPIAAPAPSNGSPSAQNAPPPPVAFMSPQHAAPPPHSATPPAVQWAPPAVAYKPPSAAKRVINPDGFGSSASDERLQKKYGNVKEVYTTAPPPTFGPPIAAPPAGDAPPFPGGNYASHNPYSMPNPYAMPTPISAPPRPMGSMSNHSSSNSLSSSGPVVPDVFNPKTDVNISVEASSTSSAVL